MDVIEMPDRMLKYAEVRNGEKRAIVWRCGIVSLYVHGKFEKSRSLRGMSLKEGIDVAKGVCA